MAPCKTGSAGARGEGSAGNFLPAVGRNSIYGDANYGIDLRIARCFHLTERLRMAILGEGFNVFNRANSNGYNSTAFNSVATTPLSAPLSLTANSNLRFPTTMDRSRTAPTRGEFSFHFGSSSNTIGCWLAASCCSHFRLRSLLSYDPHALPERPGT